MPPKQPKQDASPASQPVQPTVQPAAPVQPFEAQASQAAPPAQAGFKCCFILTFLWHCGGGYLSLPIFALCQCGNACNSSCRWLASASSFKELLGIMLSKKIAKRLGLIEN